MIDFGWVVHFWYKGNVGVVEFFKKITIPKKSLDKISDTFTNNMLVCFVKEPSETIRTWDFGET